MCNFLITYMDLLGWILIPRRILAFNPIHIMSQKTKNIAGFFIPRSPETMVMSLMTIARYRRHLFLGLRLMSSCSSLLSSSSPSLFPHRCRTIATTTFSSSSPRNPTLQSLISASTWTDLSYRITGACARFI